MTRNSERFGSTCLSIVAIALGYLITASRSAAVDSRTNPSFSLEDNSIEPGELQLLQAQQPEILLTPPSSAFHVIDECVKMTMDEGVFHYKSRGGDKVCGIYMVADPYKSISVTFTYMDVGCYDKGLISVVDGWELNGEVFPSLEDHEKPPQERFHDLCIDPTKPKHGLRRTFTSTQNAALIQYRIPAYGQGFSIHVHHVHNPRPCNILVQEVGALYRLENYGREINCSLTTLFDAKIRVISMSTGVHGSQVKYPASSRSHSSGIYHKCGKMGLHDYVQIGGSLGLDTSKMLPIEEFCGYQHHPMSKYTTIFCGMTTIRLVSSGKYQNKVVAEVRKAEFEDIDSANFICGM